MAIGLMDLDISTPSKHWYNTRTKEHYTDALIRKQGYSRIIHKTDAETDAELPIDTTDNRALMIASGFVEIYDCGQATYVYTKTEH